MVDKKLKICFVLPFAYGLFNPSAKGTAAKCRFGLNFHILENFFKNISADVTTSPSTFLKKFPQNLKNLCSKSIWQQPLNLKFGGAEVQMYLVARELAADNNFDVNFIVLDIGQKKNEVVDKVKLFKAYKQGRGLNIIWAPIKLILTLIKINPDIVVCRAAGVEAGLSAIYSQLFGKKFVYSIADDRDSNGSKFGGLRGKLFKFGFENADRIIAQSVVQEEDFKKRYPLEAGKIEIIKNGYPIGDGSKFSAKSEVLWVGSSASVKRPEIFLDLAEDFPPVRFTMIMTKSKEDPAFWEKVAGRARQLSNLNFIEPVPFNEIGGYFDKAMVLVNTSTHEGFANVFLQAAAARTPILSLKVDSDGFITKYICGYACGDDYELLKKRLAELVASEQLRDSLGENGFQYLKQEHDLKKNIILWKRAFAALKKI